MGWTEEQYRDYLASRNAVPEAPKPKRRKVTSEAEIARVCTQVPRSRQNKWEEAYEAELRIRLAAGEIQWFSFEPIKLRLADNTFFTPDFAVLIGGKLEFHEIKGFLRDDANVKFKVAAELFPFLFLMFRKKRISEGGGWELIKSIDGSRVSA